MALKDILAIVVDPSEDRVALKAAHSLAEASNAHVACAHLTALPDEPLAYEPTVVAGVWAELLNRARAEAGKARELVAAAIGAEARPTELRAAEALSRDLGRVAAVHARYADLCVLRRPDKDDNLRHDVVEGVLFHSGRAALVVPPKWAGGAIGQRVLLAWDAGREATRALSEAVKLIAPDARILVATVDAKPKAFGHGEQPGANIAAHLSRRGFATEVRNLDSTGKSPAQTLLDAAAAWNADLIVMGGYGHARVRELLFGGATRDLLETAPLPLLMAH